MKTVNTILKNHNLLARFRLLQLYTVDIFTKSLQQNEPSITALINETMLNDEEADDSSEHVLNTLIQLKRELELYNSKLNKINKVIKLQEKYAKILKTIDDSIEIGSNKVDDIIDKNNKLIEGINNLNISRLNEITQSTSSA